MANETRDSGPVQLHIVHDLGGGIEKWLGDYIGADGARRNLVLRSYAQGAAAGAGIALYEGVGGTIPLRAWTFERPIEGCAHTHEEYRAALADIVAGRGVQGILVSSLVGHSLDALATGLPTLAVTHDYFPYCPAINLHFGATCTTCDAPRIAVCHADNPDYNAFPGFTPAERERVRERYVELVQGSNVTLVSPSRSVPANLKRLDARFERVRFEVVPHGSDEALVPQPAPEPARGDRLRVLVFGQMSHAKGLRMLEEALPELVKFCEIYFLGAGEVGELFRHQPHVHVVARFDRKELAAHVASIDPHVGLLASVVEETFNYALSELWMLGVPALATRRGSFPERITEGDTGYLFEPTAAALVQALKGIDADRYTLAAIRARVPLIPRRSAGEMVADYYRILPLEARATRGATVPSDGAMERAMAAQAITAAGLWKDLKATSLQLALVSEARDRAQKSYDEDRSNARQHVADLEREVAKLRSELTAHQRAISDSDARAGTLASHLAHSEARLAELYVSTSWRVSAPVRAAGHFARRLRLLASSTRGLVRHPDGMRVNLARLRRAWRGGGMLELKKTLLRLIPAADRGDAWLEYRRTVERTVRPKVRQAVAAMERRPRVTVIVPTYNTPEPMLRAMLLSVEEQLYPEWELCVADDGSSEPHVARVLREFASRESRIKLHLGEANRGVSHASNRALAIATGEFVVLLDHDDVLEDHALFRVAESVVADDPDLLYSDEVLVSPDGNEVKRYALRPAFSLEYLRSHPYIVHLVGFRRSMLQEIGGWDERLRISQDYDLILRAAERARTIVHVPDILYQWRLHGGSAGTQKMDEVMNTSRALLTEHLRRSGEEGHVEPGAGFNFFEVRYPLAAGLKVAIVIPTKNHGELLRQCIDSIRATVSAVPYDIVVVDHESDDPATRAYLQSLADSARVLRYEGVFNFSAINNFAVSNLGEGYSHYLFCNNDIEAFEPGWLERMLELGQQPSVGIVGAMLFYPDRKHIQHAGVCVGMYGAAEHYAKWVRFPDDPIEPELMRVNREVSAVTAACMLMRADAFREVQGFDETIAVGFGDVDLCLRVGDRGYRVIISPHARLVHHESYTRGTSRGNDPHPEDSALFRLKWKPLLRAGDPFYNPGYSNEHTHWPVKQPLHGAFEIRRRIARRDAATGRTRMTFSAGQ